MRLLSPSVQRDCGEAGYLCGAGEKFFSPVRSQCGGLAVVGSGRQPITAAAAGGCTQSPFGTHMEQHTGIAPTFLTLWHQKAEPSNPKGL